MGSKKNVKEVKFYLDSESLKMIETIAEELNINRSEAVRQAIRLYYHVLESKVF